MSDDDAGVRIGPGYPLGQLAKAFVTAASHEDAETRRLAEERMRRWQRVLKGMASGRIIIGSRTPVRDMPAWVTPEVVRGGFVTGVAPARASLLAHERETARRAGVKPNRRALFTWYLTEPGVAALNELLDTGRYRIDVPEEAGLLTVAWLLRAGDRLAALTLLDTLRPFADWLRFVPRPADQPLPGPEILWRHTAGDARDAVTSRRPNARLEAMREALTVWNPFADELLGLWLETVVDGRVARHFPSDWPARAAGLLERGTARLRPRTAGARSIASPRRTWRSSAKRWSWSSQVARWSHGGSGCSSTPSTRCSNAVEGRDRNGT